MANVQESVMFTEKEKEGMKQYTWWFGNALLYPALPAAAVDVFPVQFRGTQTVI